MEHSAGRVYQRKKRKLACGYCNARHIKCKTPEQPGVCGEQFRHRSCQACIDANEECELEVPSRARSSKPSTKSSTETRRLDQQQLQTNFPAPPVSRASRQREGVVETGWQNSVREQTTVSGDHIYARLLRNHQPREGSEMLLVQLMDPSEHEDEHGSTNVASKVVYFGNDSIWSYSLQKARSSDSGKSESLQPVSVVPHDGNMHYQVSEALDDQPSNVPLDDVDLKQEEMNLLHKKGVFSLPPIDVQNRLLDAFFFWLHPLQPIIDKEQFLADFKAGQAPILLVQALLFVATSYCDDETIKRHWKTRHSAQSEMYKRVKALYDADYEQNRVTVVQVLFLMTFWWGSPTDEKDFGHWLAAAIHLAQVMGMHRSTEHSHLSIKERRLWKRIWWTLYVRDHFDAASVGRPMIINDDDCDIEPLRVSDFEEVGDKEGSRLGKGYCIEMAKLAVFIGQVVQAGRHSKGSDATIEKIDKSLSAWEKRLPEELRYHEEERDPRARLFASMLFLGFHFCKISLHRKIFLDTKPVSDSSSMAASSANAVTRIVEDLLADGLLRRAQVHLVAVVFASFTIHMISLQQSEGSRRHLLWHKAQICLLGLAELRDYWPFVDWMYRLFNNLIERLRVEHGPIEVRNNDGRDLTGQDRHDETNISDVFTTNTAVMTQGNRTKMSMAASGLDGSLMDESTAPAVVGDQTMSGMAPFENFLDPFMPLDNFDWYDQNAELFGSLDEQALGWPPGQTSL